MQVYTDAQALQGHDAPTLFVVENGTALIFAVL
jgi:hypothetical protein